jgi:hypothetical protein
MASAIAMLIALPPERMRMALQLALQLYLVATSSLFCV